MTGPRVVTGSTRWGDDPQSQRKWGRTSLKRMTSLMEDGRSPKQQANQQAMYKKSDMDRVLCDAGIASSVRRHTEVRMTDELNQALAEYAAAADVIVKARETFSALEEVVNSQIRGFMGQLRDLRMAIRSEMAAITTEMKELRAFALAPEHEQEVRRLRELCDLCDRLRALHASGLLDAVTGTIVTLMEGERGTQGRQGTGAVRATQERSEGGD